MQLQPGTLLQGGKYKIEKVLGQGGFGITYLANQELLDRQVCIKEFFFKEYCERNNDASHIILGTQSNSETVERFMAKFLKEARTISHLDHPNIIRIHDIFKENNTAYYVMDYVEGESLNEIVSRDGMLAESKAIDYIKQVASALDFIHQRGINHLDIKPANIMIRKSDNMAILIDFGLSKHYDAQGSQTSTTPVGISYGYAPMEQYNSGGVCTFSAQTDIYSLGATLYKLVTGNTPPQAMEILNDGLPQLPMTLSSGVKNAITSAMQARKSDRPENISSFLNLLSNSCATRSYDDYDSHRHQPKPQEDESTKILSNQEITEKTHQSPYVENIPQPKVVMVEEKMEKKQNKYIWYILPIVIGALILLFNLKENSKYDNNASMATEYKSTEDVYNKVTEQGVEDASSFMKGEKENVSDSEKHRSQQSPEIDYGCEYVDLGLSVKWATRNIGASDLHEYGHLYAWGMSIAGETVSYANHPLKDINQNYTLPSNYDTATNLWGAPWRMPTVYEFEELINKCKWTWVTINGHNGCKIVGPNGNSIFLPAAGSTAFDYGEKNVYGQYWSSSMLKEGAYENITGSSDWYHHRRLFFKKGQIGLSYGYGPQVAMSIRPVMD